MNDTLTPLQEAAWQRYCHETAGSMDVRDYWHQLPIRVQKIYLEKVMALSTIKVKVGDIVEMTYMSRPLQVVVGVVGEDRVEVHDFGMGRGSIGVPLERVRFNHGSVDKWHALSLCAKWAMAEADHSKDGELRKKVALRAMDFLHETLGDNYHNNLLTERSLIK